jgi:hypothetical protein
VDRRRLSNVAEWGIRSFGPDELRESSGALLEWLAATRCSRVAVHFDVDTVDSDEIVLGLGAVPGGLTSSQVRRLIADVSGAADVVGLTIAEFFPRQVMHLQQILDGFPLLSDHKVPPPRAPAVDHSMAKLLAEVTSRLNPAPHTGVYHRWTPPLVASRFLRSLGAG